MQTPAGQFNLPIGPNTLTADAFASFGTPTIPSYGAAAGPVVPEGIAKLLEALNQGSDKTGAFSSFGNGLQTVGAGVDILGGLAQIYMGLQANKLAKKQFAFQKDAYRDRLEGATKSYNTALADRANARFYTQGTPEKAAGYIAEHSLKPKGLS